MLTLSFMRSQDIAPGLFSFGRCMLGGLASHFGKDRTIALVADHFCWPSLKRDVYRIVSQCRTSQLAKLTLHSSSYPTCS